MPYFSEDVVVEDGLGNILIKNKQEFTEKYTTMFASFPNLHCEIINHMRVGRYAIDEEMISGREEEPIHCIVSYRLSADNNTIEHLRILK